MSLGQKPGSAHDKKSSQPVWSVSALLHARESRSITYIADNLSLHQCMCWCTDSVDVSLHGEFQVVLRRLPVLESVLDRVMRLRRHMVQHIVEAVSHGVVNTSVHWMRGRRVSRHARVRRIRGGNEHVARFELLLLLRLQCGAHREKSSS